MNDSIANQLGPGVSSSNNIKPNGASGNPSSPLALSINSSDHAAEQKKVPGSCVCDKCNEETDK